MDEYYYYATAIFIISAVSITTTVVETRSTMERLREISRFECGVRVLRNGFCKPVPLTTDDCETNCHVKGAQCFHVTSYQAMCTKYLIRLSHNYPATASFLRAIVSSTKA